MRILNTTEKSELGVKRNVFEKAPAYERGSKNTEHKISDFTEKNGPVNFGCTDLKVISTAVS